MDNLVNIDPSADVDFSSCHYYKTSHIQCIQPTGLQPLLQEILIPVTYDLGFSIVDLILVPGGH